MPRGPVTVNLLLLLAGCVAPAEEPRPATGLSPVSAKEWASAPRNGLDAALTTFPEWRVAPGEAPPIATDTPVAPPLPDRLLPDTVGAPTLRGATVANNVGQALTDRLSDFDPDDLNQWGLAVFTPDELFGDEDTAGLCEAPEIRYEFRDGGDDYKSSLVVYPYSAILGDPVPMLVSISEACVTGLADAEGDIDAAVEAEACAEDEAMTFFMPGSDCRTCVEGNGGDYAACNEAETCPDQVPAATWVEDAEGERHWYRGVYAQAWGCAPDYPAQFYLLADYGEDGALPRAFDHDKWAYLCTPFWSDSEHAVVTTCMGSEEPVGRNVLAEGLFGYVGYVRPKGDDENLGWRGRQYYVDSVVFDGMTVEWFVGTSPGLGLLSAPRTIPDTDGDGVEGPGDDEYGFGAGGFGFDPYSERPDGSSRARDWLAMAALKTATTIDGIPISVYETNRCAEWDGPAEDGSYRCTDVEAPAGGWLNDGYVAWTDTERTRTLSFPVATLASTGLLDEDVPGGFVVHLASSTTLALSEWDACELPHTFVPDVLPFPDAPLDWEGSSPLDGQTWRFDGKDEDFRLVLATNRARGWCGGDADGGGRSVLD